jgi:small subunit ribosomal protein S16
MLAIRLQRTGRSGHAQYRIVAQDSRFTPTSGRIAAQLGTFNPHTKAVTLNKELATTYLNNGAQPSSRVALILEKEGVALPKWVVKSATSTSAIKNQDKLRKNRPVGAAPETEAPAGSTETEAATPDETTPTEE